MLPSTRKVAEESEFSHYIFAERDDFTFVTFEGMVNDYDATVFISEHGVFYSDMKKEEIVSDEIRQRLLGLVTAQNGLPIRPTFSEEGVETENRRSLVR